MPRWLCWLVCLSLLLPIAGTAGAEPLQTVEVAVGDSRVTATVNQDGRTLVPARFVAEALGAKVAWSPENRTVTISLMPTEIVLTIGQRTARVNGREMEMDTTAAIAPDGRTMVPLRFIAEALGLLVKWNPETRTVGLLDPALAELPATANLQGDGGSPSTSGRAVRQGDWIYFANYADQYRLYRMRLDGSEVRRLAEPELVLFINVVGEWIYYVAATYDQRWIHKVRLDGSGAEVIRSDKTEAISVRDGWIYLIDRASGRQIYRMRTDGTNLSLVAPLRTNDFVLGGDWIYHDVSGSGLWKVRTDGTEPTLLVKDAAVYDMIRRADGLYFTTGFDRGPDTGSIRRISPGGSRVDTVIEGGFNTYLVSDGEWLYYAQGSPTGGPLYRVRPDGSERTLLTSDRACRISLVGDWLLYEDGENSGIMMRIRTDGTGRSRLVNGVWEPLQ